MEVKLNWVVQHYKLSYDNVLHFGLSGSQFPQSLALSDTFNLSMVWKVELNAIKLCRFNLHLRVNTILSNSTGIIDLPLNVADINCLYQAFIIFFLSSWQWSVNLSNITVVKISYSVSDFIEISNLVNIYGFQKMDAYVVVVEKNLHASA